MKRMILLGLAALACLMLSACAAKPAGGVRVLLDGAEWRSGSAFPEDGDPLRVYITLDGAALIDLPFGQAHTVTIEQPEVGENTVLLTGDSVRMDHADCENQDCVNMGEVTRENLEFRVMGGFIVCLPHRISVEVRGK